MPHPDPSLLTCWTGTSLETQPRVRPQDAAAGGPDRLTVTLVVGAWCPLPGPTPQVGVQADYFDGAGWQPVVCDNACALTAAELDRRTTGKSDVDWLDAQSQIADVRDRLSSRATATSR